MPVENLGKLVPAATAVGKAGYKHFTDVKKQLGASELGGQSFATEVLNNHLKTALDRLLELSPDASLWRKAKYFVEERYRVPNFLRQPYVRDWLSSPDVQAAALTAARISLIGSPIDEASLSYLIISLSSHSGENESIVSGTVLTVIKYLSLEVENAIQNRADVAVILERLDEEFQKTNKEQAWPLTSAVSIQAHHSEDAKKELKRILESRFCVSTSTTLDWLKRLEKDVSKTGRLAAAADIKEDIEYWIARIEASAGRIELAKEYLSGTKETQNNISILKALIAISLGTVDEAIGILQKDKTADAYGCLLFILMNYRSEDEALDWFDSLEMGDETFNLAGWLNLLPLLIKNRRCEQIQLFLQSNFLKNFEKYPAMNCMIGNFALCQMFSECFHPSILDGRLIEVVKHAGEGGEQSKYLELASCYFKKAFNQARQLRLGDFLAELDYIQSLLRLIDPKQSSKERERLQSKFKEFPQDLIWLEHILVFSIQVDWERFDKYFEDIMRVRRFTVEELSQHTAVGNHRELYSTVIQEIEDYWIDLSDKDKSFFSPRLIDCYINSREISKAKSALVNYRDLVPDDVLAQLELKFEDVTGDTPVEKALNNYSNNGTIVNLENLIKALQDSNNFDELERYTLELYRVESKVKNALAYVQCAWRNGRGNESLLKFLDKCPELVKMSPMLQFYKASCLYDLGRIVDAKRFFPQLEYCDKTEQTVWLEINIALTLGEWDRVTSIVIRELPELSLYSASFLLFMGNAVVHTAQEEAVKLATAAVKKSSDTQEVLIGAHRIASLAGHDDLASRWIHIAAEMDCESSLIKKVPLSEVVSFVEQSGNDRQRMAKSFQLAEIPVHFFVEEFSLPLSNYYLVSQKCDVRYRGLCPAISLLQHATKAKIKKISLDITTIMLLYQMGILNDVIDYFETVMVAPNIMFILHREHGYVTHHQPSVIEKSKQLIGILSDRVLSVDGFAVPDFLLHEVGLEDAQLLVSAAQRKGFFVHPGKIYQSGSLMDKEAELGEYKDRILPLYCLVEWLFRSAEIDDDIYKEALDFLERNGGKIEDGVVTTNFDDVPIYLDRLSVDYLHQMQLIDAVVNSDLEVFIHPHIYEEWRGYLALENHTQKICRSLKNIRKILQKALAYQKVQFMPRNFSEDDIRAQRYGGVVNAVIHTLSGARELDAVAFDDRFLHSYGWVSDIENNLPILNAYDLLLILKAQGQVTNKDFLKAKKSLYESGWGPFPLDHDELFREISNCKMHDGKLRENAKIKRTRESVNFLLGSSFLTKKERLYIFDNCLISSLNLLHSIWGASLSKDEDVYARASWVLQYIFPPISRVKEFEDDQVKQLELIVERVLQPLFLKPRKCKLDRFKLWCRWVQQEIFNKLLPANASILDAFSKKVAESFVQYSKQLLVENEVADDELLFYKRQLILDALANVPEELANRIYRQEEIITFCHLRFLVHQVGTISHKTLVKAYQSVEKTDRTYLIETLEGDSVEVRYQEEGVLRFSKDSDEPIVDVTGLVYLSKNSAERLSAINNASSMCVFTPPKLVELRELVGKNHTLLGNMLDLIDIISNAPGNFFSKVEKRLQAGEAISSDLLFPSSRQYYEMLIGPVTNAANFDEYLSDTLLPLHDSLLKQDPQRVLSYCLAAAVRNDVVVPACYEYLGDSFFINWIEDKKDDLTPIELLALLSIVSARKNSDCVYSRFMDEAIERLCSESYEIGVDCQFYDIFPQLLSFCLKVIDTQEELFDCPVYWKRLAAFVHCQALLKIVKNYVDHKKFTEWCGSLSAGITTCDFLNFYKEPLWMRIDLSAYSLHAELIGQLNILCNDSSKVGFSQKHKKKVETYFESLSEQTHIKAYCCGPLEGHQKWKYVTGEFEKAYEAINNVISKFVTSRSEIEAVKLITLTFYSRFDEKGLEELVQSISEKPIRYSEYDEKRRYFFVLHSLAGIAGTQTSTELAESLCKGLIAEAPYYDCPEDAKAGLYAILLSAAAYEDESTRLDWLGAKLMSYALKLPKKAPAQACCKDIEQLERLLPVEKQRFGDVICLLKSCA
ncbi:hypothetical protein [Halodesulfovibrio marinisediminis]|uniref:Uncharacterized protein n=1 Tax=Halodesulfovibrio marinisediminis DSM 17456 TaxID=1121457 RepID=A0A1N6JAM4_9BACT|nr:hypothetical protein [Halodesulfovibrio marinisediminis]SIO41315.1 hypothetical protein SAMN02745161_3287 [Halodesulfovibrio marinisediminis DSM 17456]